LEEDFSWRRIDEVYFGSAPAPQTLLFSLAI
jgi:hypothetical protein